jgi:hypothetical protein
MESNEAGKNHVSRRALLRTGAVTGAVAAVTAGGSLAAADTASADTGPGGSQRQTSPAGDLILYNGKIHTVDSHGTVASVLAIRGGIIVYVGQSLQSARQQFSTAPQAIDLAGKVAVPRRCPSRQPNRPSRRPLFRAIRSGGLITPCGRGVRHRLG